MHYMSSLTLKRGVLSMTEPTICTKCGIVYDNCSKECPMCSLKKDVNELNVKHIGIEDKLSKSGVLWDFRLTEQQDIMYNLIEYHLQGVNYYDVEEKYDILGGLLTRLGAKEKVSKPQEYTSHIDGITGVRNYLKKEAKDSDAQEELKKQVEKRICPHEIRCSDCIDFDDQNGTYEGHSRCMKGYNWHQHSEAMREKEAKPEPPLTEQAEPILESHWAGLFRTNCESCNQAIDLTTIIHKVKNICLEGMVKRSEVVAKLQELEKKQYNTIYPENIPRPLYAVSLKDVRELIESLSVKGLEQGGKKDVD